MLPSFHSGPFLPECSLSEARGGVATAADMEENRRAQHVEEKQEWQDGHGLNSGGSGAAAGMLVCRCVVGRSSGRQEGQACSPAGLQHIQEG